MRRSKGDNNGFTLVELIVVLVILAILAAILVPQLLGYIDRAKQDQYIFDAKNCMTAVQAELAEQYAYDSVVGLNDDSMVGSNPHADVSWMGTPQAKRILQTAEVDPYMLIVGMGDYEKFKDTDLHKAYTVYFVVYWPEENKDPIFFNGSEWKKEYPWKGDGQNTFKVNGQDMKLQFYFIKAPGDNASKMSNYWNRLKNKVGVQ